MDLYSLKNKQLLQVESNPFDLEKDIQTIVENNTQELFNLQCWALTCETFLSVDQWIWLYKQAGYSGDYEFIYFK